MFNPPENIAGDDFEEGQEVYVSSRLKSQSFFKEHSDAKDLDYAATIEQVIKPNRTYRIHWLNHCPLVEVH